MADYLQTGVSTIKELLAWFTERSRSADTTTNNILRELRDNIKLLEHRNNTGVNRLAIVQKLSVQAINAAYVVNYKFDRLCTYAKALPASFILSKYQEKYIGWTAKQFIYNIEGKIRDLQSLPTLYPDIESAPINLTRRLDNLYFQLLLLGIFLSKKP